MTTAFDFREAFSRTIGWVRAEELALLRQKRVAIAGLGGVGGSHLLTHSQREPVRRVLRLLLDVGRLA